MTAAASAARSRPYFNVQLLDDFVAPFLLDPQRALSGWKMALPVLLSAC